MFTSPARIRSPAAQRRTRRVRAQLPSTLRSTGHVAPAGRVATTAGAVGVSVSGLATARSRKEPPGSGVSPRTNRASTTSSAASSTREQRRTPMNGRGSPKRAGRGPTTSTPQPELA